MLSEQCFNRVYFTKQLTSKVQYMHSIVIVCIILEMSGVNCRTGKAGCLSICCSWINCSCHLCLFVIQWNMCWMLNFKILSWSDICWYIMYMTLYCVPLNFTNKSQGKKVRQLAISTVIVHSTKSLNFDWSRAVQLNPKCTP